MIHSFKNNKLFMYDSKLYNNVGKVKWLLKRKHSLLPGLQKKSITFIMPGILLLSQNKNIWKHHALLNCKSHTKTPENHYPLPSYDFTMKYVKGKWNVLADCMVHPHLRCTWQAFTCPAYQSTESHNMWEQVTSSLRRSVKPHLRMIYYCS